MSFPERVYTAQEVKIAKALVDQGYKHNLTVEGTPEFTQKVNRALELIKTAGVLRLSDNLHSENRGNRRHNPASRNRSRHLGKQVRRGKRRGLCQFVNPKGLSDERVPRRRTLLWRQRRKTHSGKTHGVFAQCSRKKAVTQAVKEECERLLDMWKESSLAF